MIRARICEIFSAKTEEELQEIFTEWVKEITMEDLEYADEFGDFM